MNRTTLPYALALLCVFVLGLMVFASQIDVLAASERADDKKVNDAANRTLLGGESSGMTRGLWVFGDSIVPHPVLTAEGRTRLVSSASASGVTDLYVSVFSPTVSPTGRNMYPDSDLAALVSSAHQAGLKVWAEHGNSDWPTFGCTANDRPVQRIQGIVDYNAAVAADARFDGVMLDVEPGAAFDLPSYADLHQCIRSVLPANMKLGTAINAFWNGDVTYQGVSKPAYAHIIDLPLDSIVIMGYRDTAGTAVCPGSNGLICLDRDEIAYADSIGRTGRMLVGLETINVVPGQTENVSFFEEGHIAMEAESRRTAAYFADSPSFGGFAVHNYAAAFLSGTPLWPENATVRACTLGTSIEVESSVGTPIAGYAELATAFGAINAGLHQGNILIEICGDASHTGSAVLNGSGAGLASYSTVDIYPVGGPRSISGSPSNGRGVVELNMTSNVTIDGDDPTTAGVARNLTFKNDAASTVTLSPVIRLAMPSSTSWEANDNQIRNVNVEGNAVGMNISTATSISTVLQRSYGIFVGPGGTTTNPTAVPTQIGSENISVASVGRNLLVRNNQVVNVGRGISLQASSHVSFPGLLVEGNVIGNPTAGDPNQVYITGLFLSGSSDAIVRRNTIYVESFAGTNLRGIDFASLPANGHNPRVEANKVLRVRNRNTAANGAAGINIGNGNNAFILNNFITGVISGANGNFSGTSGSYGIRTSDNTGVGHRIYHNTVLMSGAVSGTGSTLSCGLLIGLSVVTGMDVRNNIFANVQLGGHATSPAFASICWPSNANEEFGLTLNNNAYVQGADANRSMIGYPGLFYLLTFTRYKAADFNPLLTSPSSNMRSATRLFSVAGTNDNASVVFDPMFVSADDLHLQAGSPLIGLGAGIAAVTHDIDGQPRDAVSPDIGADEVLGPTAAEVRVTGRVGDAAGMAVRGASVTIEGGLLIQPVTVRTGTFGNFAFDGLRAGETYTITVSAGRHAFKQPSITLTLYEDLTGLEFTALR